MSDKENPKKFKKRFNGKAKSHKSGDAGKKPNYNIIRLEREVIKVGWFKPDYVGMKKIVMKKFYAKDDAAAYEYLKEYRKLANKEYTYYFDKINVYRVVDKDKTVHEFDSIDDYFKHGIKKDNWFVRAWASIVGELEFRFVTQPRDAYHWVKEVIYFIKHRHNYRESWSLDYHMLDDLLWNLPILIKDKHGISPIFLDQAICEEHKDEKDFDIRKWNETHYQYTDAQEKRAIELQDAEYTRAIDMIRAYNYFKDAGIIDCGNQTEVETDKKYRAQLPVKPGSYDLIDYRALDKISQHYWNKIWDWVKKYGQSLWD